MSFKQNKFWADIFLKKTTYNAQIKEIFLFKINLLKEEYSQIEEEKFKKIMDESEKKYYDSLTSFIANYFSEQELKDLVAFYASNIGKKLIDKIFILTVNDIIQSSINSANEKLEKEKRE